jgi:hypothetical protein
VRLPLRSAKNFEAASYDEFGDRFANCVGGISTLLFDVLFFGELLRSSSWRGLGE